MFTAGNASGVLHCSGELGTSGLALCVLSDNPHYSHSVNATEVNQGVQDPPSKTHSLWSFNFIRHPKHRQHFRVSRLPCPTKAHALYIQHHEGISKYEHLLKVSDTM